MLEKLLGSHGARDCYGYARAKMMQSVVGVVVVDGVNEAEEKIERSTSSPLPNN